MSQDLREVIFDLSNGEDSSALMLPGLLGPGTQNVYLSRDGELVSYGGNVAILGVDANLTGKRVIDVAVFFDSVGRRRRLLITSDYKLYELVGRTLNEIYSFDYEYRMFVTNQNMVVFVSQYANPYKFDGHSGVTNLGVTEVPSPPEISLARLMSPAHQDYDTANCSSLYFRSYQTWGVTDPDTGFYDLVNPMQDQAAIADALDRDYEYIIRWINARGQFGPACRPTRIALAPAVDPTPAVPTDDDRINLYPVIEWQPSRGQPDIVAAALYRSLNLAGSDDLAVHQLLDVIPVPCCRFTDMRADGSLGEPYDKVSGYPAPRGNLVCIFKDLMLISGDPENPHSIRYSAPAQYEDWPLGNGYLALGKVLAIIPLSKSVVVVTDSTLETLTVDENGFLIRSRTESTTGAVIPGSFVVKSDSVVGWFDQGFGTFDGFQFRSGRTTNSFITKEIHRTSPTRALILPDGDYLIAQIGTDGASQMFRHNFMSGGWFRLSSSDKASCFWIERGDVFCGGYENIYAFDKGGYSEGRIEVNIGGLERRSAPLTTFRKYVKDLFARLKAIGVYEYTFELISDGLVHKPVATGSVDAYELIDSVFGTTFRWDSDTGWTGPRRFWARLESNKLDTDRRVGESFQLVIKFTGAIALSAVYVAFGVDDQVR